MATSWLLQLLPGLSSEITLDGGWFIVDLAVSLELLAKSAVYFPRDLHI